MADWYFRDGNKSNGLKVCPGCRNLVRDEEFCPLCARRLRPQGGVRGLAKRIFSRPDAMTRILLGMIVVVFILQFVADFFLPLSYHDRGGGGLFSFLTNNGVTYIRMGSNFHLLVLAWHEYWRWVTYCFLHLGILHILFNGWAFWDLGRIAERLWGAKQVFATFILTGIVGGAFSFGAGIYIFGRASNSLGASGAICGILGLLLGSYYRNKYHVGEYLGAQLVRWAVYIIAFGLAIGADNAAHIGGMLSGAVLGYFLLPSKSTKNFARDSRIWTVLAVLSFVLLLASVVMAILFYSKGPQILNQL